MAMTGGTAKLVKTSTTSANTTLKLYVYYKSTQDVTNNCSTITMGMYITISSGSIGSWTDGYGSYLGTTSNTFNGSIPNVSGTRWIVENKTMTVNHNSDGTKTATIYWKWGVNSSWGGMVKPSGSFNITLPTIPRATTPTFSALSVNMGSSVTITLNRASSSFTHRLSYKFGSLTNQTSGLSSSSSVGTSATFTPPLTLANQIPNATSGTCTITCETYNGSTLIGTKTATLTLNVPSSVVPSISAVSITEATTGIAAKFNAFIQNKSTLDVAITAAGSYGSTITKYETYIQAVPYREASFTSALITASGTVGVVTTVTDSRGRTKQVSNSITVLAYSSPVINIMTAWRIDTSGTAKDDGTKIAMRMKFAMSSVNNLNNLSYKFQYRLSTETNFTTFASGVAYATYDGTQYFTTSAYPTISTDNSYVIRLEISDFFESVTFDCDIPTGFTLVDYNSSGKGIAFGKVSQKDAFEVAMPAEFTEGLQYKAIHIEPLTSPLQDLDDYKTAGIYEGNSGGSDNHYIENCPVYSVTFTLEIMNAGDVGQVLQRFSVCDKTNPAVHARLFYGDEWGDWYLLTGDTPTPTPTPTTDTNRYFILVGDSYGVPYQSGSEGWIDSFKAIKPSNWIVKAAQSGAGVGLQKNTVGGNILTKDLFEVQSGHSWTYNSNMFYANKMVKQQLSDASFDASKITDIVIIGGRNDMNYLETSSSVTSDDVIESHATACKDLNSWLKTQYPNATVHWGMVGWGAAMYGGDARRLNYILSGWIKGCGYVGSENASYLSGVEYALHDADLFGTNAGGGTPTTTTHPNYNGCRALARAIVQAIKTGSWDCHYKSEDNFTLSNSGLPLSWNSSATDSTSKTGVKFHSELTNGITQVFTEQIFDVVPTATTASFSFGTLYKLGRVKLPFNAIWNDTSMVRPLYDAGGGYVQSSDNTVNTCQFYLRFETVTGASANGLVDVYFMAFGPLGSITAKRIKFYLPFKITFGYEGF